MGFGPRASNVAQGVQAVEEIVRLLYPERATERAVWILGRIAEALLAARVALHFQHIDRFLRDPDWRQWVLSRIEPSRPGFWDLYPGEALEPDQLDPDFGWLVADRLQTTQEEGT